MKRINTFSKSLIAACIAGTLSLSSTASFAYNCKTGWHAFEKHIYKNSEWNSYLNSSSGGNINNIANSFKNMKCPALKAPYLNNPFYYAISCDFFKPALHNGGYLADPQHPADFRISGCTRNKPKKITIGPRNTPNPVDPRYDHAEPRPAHGAVQ